jgi:hypothetical protein
MKVVQMPVKTFDQKSKICKKDDMRKATRHLKGAR